MKLREQSKMISQRADISCDSSVRDTAGGNGRPLTGGFWVRPCLEKRSYGRAADGSGDETRSGAVLRIR